jgi:hypothetical protein
MIIHPAKKQNIGVADLRDVLSPLAAQIFGKNR